MTDDPLLIRLRHGADPEQARWVEHAVADARGGTRDRLLRLYTEASQRLGRRTLTPDPGRALPSDLAAFDLDRWTAEDLGRALLLRARGSDPTQAGAFVEDAIACFDQGDTREQRSWLRGVGLLPGPERFLPTVVDACRTNILTLFEAIACENPYLARYFPEPNFNQVVLKALFTGVALARIVGLPERANPELARMARDYAAERRAAGRSVPADIDLATTAG